MFVYMREIYSPNDDTVTQETANDGQLWRTGASVIFCWTKHVRLSTDKKQMNKLFYFSFCCKFVGH